MADLKIKQKIRWMLEEIVYLIHRFLGQTYWFHLGDLLTPCEGNVTAGQYIVVSRVLDIEKIIEGGDPEWQNLISDRICGHERSQEDKQKANQNFKLLVESLDSRGLNPNIAKCSISDNPVVLNNGTHRIGWCVLREPNMYVPCVRERHDLVPWFPVEGKKYFDKILDKKQLDVLEDRFNKILKENVRTDLTAFINQGAEKELADILNEYGEITESCQTIVTGEVLTVFRFHLNKQFLFTKGKHICSKYVCEMESRLNGKGKFGHTVTESVQIENWIEEKTGQKLFEKDKRMVEII